MPTQTGTSLNRQLSTADPDGTTLGQSLSDIIYLNGTLNTYNGVISPAVFGFVNSAITNTTGTIISAAALAAGYITRSGPTAAFTDTLDTATNVYNAYQVYGGIPVGLSAYVEYKNTTNYPATIALGTGFTISGTINTSFVVPANSEAFFLISPTSATTAQIFLSSTGNGFSGIGNEQYSAATNTTAFTATTAQMVGAAETVLSLTGTLASGQAITTPTAAQIIAALPNATVGSTYALVIVNNSAGAFAWTLTGGTNVTITGTATIAQNVSRRYLVTVATASTVTMQNLYSGAN